MEKKINTGKVVFIQCRLTSNTCFFFVFFFHLPKFSRAAHEHVVAGLKIYIYKAPRPRGQTNMAQQELISASFEGNRLNASLNPGEEGGGGCT